MAAAKQAIRVVEERCGVELTLTDDEADLLFFLLHRVGGDCFDSPRKHADAMRRALAETGRTSKSSEYIALDALANRASAARGGIYFTPGTA